MKPAIPACLLVLLVLLGASCERSAVARRVPGVDELERERAALEADRRRLEQDRLEFEARRGSLPAGGPGEVVADEAGEPPLAAPAPEAEPTAVIPVVGDPGDGLPEDPGVMPEAGPGAAPEPGLAGDGFEEPLPVADFNLFYEGLEEHGSWYETDDYGYVFQPRVVVHDSGWRPYLHGRWHCTDHGWYWDSQEPFGWATYHYGRWVRIVGRGWCWVPGFRWAPSWVCWREGAEGIGWAPLPPETLWLGDEGYGSGVEVDFGVPVSWFVFIETRHVSLPVWRHCVPPRLNRHWWDRCRPCTRIVPYRGRVHCGGPRYGQLVRGLDRPWPVRRIGFDSVDGLRGGGLGRSARRGGLVDGRLRAFAPRLDAPWNARLCPSGTSARLGRVEVDRGGLAANPLWLTRAREARRDWNRLATDWCERAGVGRGRLNERSREVLAEHRRRLASVPAEPSAGAVAAREVSGSASRRADEVVRSPRVGTGRLVRPARSSGAGVEPASRVPRAAANPGLPDGMSRGRPGAVAAAAAASRRAERNVSALPAAPVPERVSPSLQRSSVRRQQGQVQREQAARVQQQLRQQEQVRQQAAAARERASQQTERRARQQQERLQQAQQQVRQRQEQARQLQARQRQEQTRQLQARQRQDQAQRDAQQRARQQQARQQQARQQQVRQQQVRQQQVRQQQARQQQVRQQQVQRERIRQQQQQQHGFGRQRRR